MAVERANRPSIPVITGLSAYLTDIGKYISWSRQHDRLNSQEVKAFHQLDDKWQEYGRAHWRDVQKDQVAEILRLALQNRALGHQRLTLPEHTNYYTGLENYKRMKERESARSLARLELLQQSQDLSAPEGRQAATTYFRNIKSHIERTITDFRFGEHIIPQDDHQRNMARFCKGAIRILST